jgi:hypothetical protein
MGLGTVFKMNSRDNGSLGVERGSADLSHSTCHDITWPINAGCTIPGGTTGVLGVMVMPYHSEHRWSRVGAVYASDIWRLEDAAVGCPRPCRRLRRAPARHTRSLVRAYIESRNNYFLFQE